jgi:fibronectin type 3 domain-containing protein
MAVTLLWSAVSADDLAGYLVLRSGGGDDFTPLFREPAAATSYRDERVQPGATYAYAVIALDKAGNPSAQSNRQTVTVR